LPNRRPTGNLDDESNTRKSCDGIKNEGNNGATVKTGDIKNLLKTVLVAALSSEIVF
jgi:hypothetical protein